MCSLWISTLYNFVCYIQKCFLGSFVILHLLINSTQKVLWITILLTLDKW
jgi:hypothetical protein